jgi:uncharacterized protein YraI
MKSKIAAIACILVLVGAWVYAHASVSPTATVSLPIGPAGRYQITSAEIDIPGTDGAELKYKGAIRIDTQTGQTWTLGRVVNRDTGAVTLLWTKMDEETGTK